jgi:signal transduction histidine kinase
MRERVALFGGLLTTHALPNGFRVTATLPYAPGAS